MNTFLTRVKAQDPSNPDNPYIQRLSEFKLTPGNILIKKHIIGEKSAAGLHLPNSGGDMVAKNQQMKTKTYKHNDTLAAEVLMVCKDSHLSIYKGDWIIACNIPRFDLLLFIDDRLDCDKDGDYPIIDTLLIHESWVQGYFREEVEGYD